ncbi:MAG: enoyl-CoA hydratase/isomerase family protein [SAR324 cluster bacterium]|nr:enoyl-CoA hydratase/isomerase family protein [SAR324 cluster bacterium]
MSETVLLNISQGVATLTLNRPEIHNAFDDLVIHQLVQHLESLAIRKELRLLVLASEGKSFSAGADLNWMRRMKDLSLEENARDASALARLMSLLNGFPLPTIAVVQGAAFGGAVGLVACCDIALASSKASFSLSEVKVGLVPATISPYVLQAIGSRAARRLFLTGERFSAQEALKLGLVHEVVEPDQLGTQKEALIQTLLNNGPEALKTAKNMIFQVANQPINDELIAYTTQLIAQIRISEEGQEGLSAFLEKRSPNWVHLNRGEK